MSLKSATKLHSECIKQFGLEYVNWDPIIIREETKYDQEDLDKIQAICTLISTDHYYTYMESFFLISRILNLKPATFEVLYPLEAAHIVWSILEAKLNDVDFGIFSEEVIAYIKTCFQFYGVPHIPEQLKKIFPKMKYRNDPDEEFDKEIQEYIDTRMKKLLE